MSLITGYIPKYLGIKMHVTYSQMVQKIYVHTHIQREGGREEKRKGEKEGGKGKKTKQQKLNNLKVMDISFFRYAPLENSGIFNYIKNARRNFSLSLDLKCNSG